MYHCLAAAILDRDAGAAPTVPGGRKQRLFRLSSGLKWLATGQ